MEIDMHTPQLVAVGADGAPNSRAALAWAADEALARGVHLCVFHCWRAPVVLSAVVPGTVSAPSAVQQAREAAGLVLTDSLSWLRQRYPSLPMTGAVLSGPPGPRLVGHVRQRDLLVVGLGSRHRVLARLVGSTVEHALRHARCTVVVVPSEPPGSPEPTGRGPFHGHVVAAIDSSDISGATSAVVGAAFGHAAEHGLPLAVVHANPDRAGSAGAVTLVPPADEAALDSVVQSWQARYPHVVVHRATFAGPPDVVIEHVAAGARLLVIGRSRHPHHAVRLVDHVLAKVHCPVAVTPLAVQEAAPQPHPSVLPSAVTALPLLYPASS